MDWENNCMTGMMVNFLFLHLHTHHHHPACGGDVLVLCAKNHKQHAFCKPFQLMCYQAYACCITVIYCSNSPCHSNSCLNTFRTEVHINSLLSSDMFTKLQKVTISFITSECPSTQNNSAPTGRIFMKFEIQNFWKSVEEIQVWLKSDNNRHFIWTSMYIFDNFSEFFLEWKTLKKKKCRENHNTCAIYEIMWKNTVQPDMPQLTIPSALCTLDNWGKKTDTHAQYLMLTAFPWQQWLHKYATVLPYMYLAYLVASVLVQFHM